MEHFQDARLLDLFKHAVSLPLWKDVFSSTGADISRHSGREIIGLLPIFSKKDFLLAKQEHYTDATLFTMSRYDQTSGSTGRPFPFYHDAGYELRSYAICERMMRTAGSGKRLPLIIVRRGGRMGFAFTNYSFFYLDNYNSLQHRLSALLALIRSKGEVVLFMWSSVALEFSRLLNMSRERPFIRGIIVSGESLSDDRRAQIEDATGARVSILYGASDMGRLAFECEKQQLHVNEEWAYVEIVDEAGNQLPGGVEGRLVVTLFDNRVMPFIRYDSGDLGILSDKPCSCGRTLRTLQVRGRQMHLLSFPDGRTVSILDVAGSFDRRGNAVHQFQIVRTGPYALTIRVVPNSHFEESREELTDTLTQLIHPSIQIRWETTTGIESGRSGKAVYFIDQTSNTHV
ncbi:MAG TPA: hypothetical protein VJI74_02625 [Candidatus Paceibacterota bacterium]